MLARAIRVSLLGYSVNAECRYADCPYTECHQAVIYTIYCIQVHYTEFCYAECRKARKF